MFETRFQEIVLCPKEDVSSKREVVESIIIVGFEDPKGPKGSQLDISQMVQGYFQDTTIKTSFSCERCRTKFDRCEKQMTAVEVPRVMIVALSRFTYDKERQNYRKLTDKVQIGDYLLLDNVQTKARNVKYKLNSFINHMGSTLESGHYQAYVRHPR